MKGVESFVSREVFEKLNAYVELLLKWNGTINLVSPATTHEIAQRHILDSLQLLKFIKDKSHSVVDLGSGAGFPGVVLSIAGIQRVTLIESDARKSAFLFQAAQLSSNRIEILNDRIENAKNLQCDILTSRAFSDLDSIFHHSQNIVVKEKYLLHKGQTYQEEILEARKHWLFNIKVHDSITSAEGKILEITDLVPNL